MLKDDLEVGVLGNEGPERREELGLGVHDGHAVGGAAGDFAVQVEDDAFFFHGLEDVVEGVEGEDAPFGVGGGAFGVGLGVCEFWEGGGGKGGGGYLDTGNAGLFGLADLIGGDARVEVEGHEVGDAGVDGLKLALVLEGLVHRHDGAWCQVGHDKDDVDAGRADGGGHQLGDGARCVAEMHMHIGRGGQDVFVLEGHFGGGRWGVAEMGEGSGGWR